MPERLIRGGLGEVDCCLRGEFGLLMILLVIACESFLLPSRVEALSVFLKDSFELEILLFMAFRFMERTLSVGGGRLILSVLLLGVNGMTGSKCWSPSREL